MRKIIIALLLFLLAVPLSYAGSTKRPNTVATDFFRNFMESQAEFAKQHKLDEQKENLDSDYRNGKISADAYYEATARIDQNKLEREKAVSLRKIQQQQINVQQQQINLQRIQENRRLYKSGGGRTKTVIDKNSNVVGYILE